MKPKNLNASNIAYKPVADQDEKLDIIEHINQDHQDAVLVMAQHYYPNKSIDSAMIADMFEEGAQIQVNTSKGKQELFIKFELRGGLEEQVLYLAYVAMSKQGKDLTGGKKQYFEVIEKKQLTTNITRLTLQSKSPLPTDYAGYAYRMILKKLNKTPDITEKTVKNKIGFLKKLRDKALLWVFKKISSQRRQKMAENMSKGSHIYTLRSAWQADNSSFNNQGFMDVFTHIRGTKISEGGQWTESLTIGDVVFSQNESVDKHSHLATGSTLLIADETAYPALAGILDLWKNPVAPLIIIISQQETEQGYFGEGFGNSLPIDSIVHRIISPVDNQAQEVIDIIEKMDKIDSVWGALENECAKNIRHYLRNSYGLTWKNNHVKGYWRLR